MKKYLETFLLSVLLGTSVLLGLAFWLNIKFNFNLFSAHHWNELAKLQVSHTPINIVFYISMGVALFILIFGLYMIFRPRFRKITITNNVNTVESITPIIPEKTTEPQVSRPATFLQQPPKLHLPKNMATIVAQQYQNGANTTMQ